MFFASVDFSKCQRYLAAGVGHNIAVMNIARGRRLRCLEDHVHTVSVLKFNSSATKIVSSCSDRIIIWDRRSQSPLLTFRGSFNVSAGFALSRDQSKLFSITDDRYMRAWDVCTGLLLNTFDPTAVASSISTSPTDELA